MAYNLANETWAEYGIGMAFLFLRLFARVRTSGFRGLQVDDAFSIVAMSMWTMQTIIIHFLNVYGNNIGLNEATAMAVPDDQVPTLVLGSKLAFMNWIWYLSFIWSLKAVLLLLYNKLTEGTRSQRLVIAASGFTVLCYLACILTHVCICTPVHRSWQVKPYPGDSCTIRKENYYVIASLNVVTDVIIMLIPIPILMKLQLPIERKIILLLMFSSGIFIMICTILRAYYSLKDIATLNIALGWATRECFVAAIVVSLPGIKPLFRNIGWLGTSHRDERSTHYNNLASKTSGDAKTLISSHTGKNTKSRDQYEMGGVTGTRVEGGGRLSSAGESEEHILHTNGKSYSGGGRDTHKDDTSDHMGIRVTTEYELRHENR